MLYIYYNFLEVNIMDYSQVILEMLDRIKTLENKVKELEECFNSSMSARGENGNDQLERVSVKYRGLSEYLLSSGASRISLTYAQIEQILGFPLPQTARRFKQSYWANTETHSYASSWMAVGYKAKVDLNSDTVTFFKNLI